MHILFCIFFFFRKKVLKEVKSSAICACLTHRPWSQGLKRHRWGKLEEMNDLFPATQLAVWFIFLSSKLYISALRDYHPHNFTPRFHLAPHILVLFRSAPNISAATAKKQAAHGWNILTLKNRGEWKCLTLRRDRDRVAVNSSCSIKNSSNKLFESRKKLYWRYFLVWSSDHDGQCN